MIKLFSLFWFCPLFSPVYGDQTISKLHPQVNGEGEKKKKKKKERDLRQKRQEFYTS